MSDSSDTTPRCLYCEQSSHDVPLVALRYGDDALWICPLHLPLLIHNPARLVGKLPGAEKLVAAEHEH